ncbi:MAG: hypothetical protein LQ348_003958 [Seirophora lacunosa]|nr:MAG: hypothetical protein LQ348_003958 [Seirophora lacunosa]
MASQEQEADGKSRKSQVDTKRDPREPRVSSRRYPLSQQAPVFETESLLNTSNVHSPNPTKSYARPTSRTQSRQAFNSGRSLASAYAPTPRKNDENKPPFSTGSSSRNTRHSPLKPRPRQSPRFTATGKAGTSDTRLKTPSPHRGRQNSIVSPSSSASSPPRGLAEAYQRIVDEEILAHEESIEEMAEDAESLSASGAAQLNDRPRWGNTATNESPTSLKASRRATTPVTQEEHKPTKPNFRDIYESLGDVENDTAASMLDSVRSESPRADSQHAKDLRRMNGAVKSEAQIFRKALVGNRVGLTVENLRRNDDGSDSLSSSLGGSISSRTSDPSINVPRHWGRKARPGKDWLSRINSRSGRLTGDVPKRRILDDVGLASAEQREFGDKPAAAAAEVPLPSGDDVSSQAASSRSSTPTTAALRSKSRDRVLEWELQDEDFTGRSLQVSDSPPIRIRNAKLDKILEREISTVAKRAVTTSRLGELREKGSSEHIGRRSPSRSRDRSQEPNGRTALGEPTKQESRPLLLLPASDEAKTPSKTTVSLGYGESIPDTPVVIYKSDTSSSRANEDSLDSEILQRSAAERPKHGRHDSHDLLRKLARATSASPGPSREFLEVPAEQGPPDYGREANGNADEKTEKFRESEPSTPEPSRSKAYLKTPMVSGAWIDTPLPTGGRGPPMPTPDLDVDDNKTLQRDAPKIATGDLIRKLSPHTSRPKIADEELKRTAPRLPKSALESIINAAKSRAPANGRRSPCIHNDEDATLLLGDSTIHSLEELMANETDASALPESASTTFGSRTGSSKVDKPLSSESPYEAEDDSPPASPQQSDRPRLTDPQAYARQLSRLSNLVPSLRETKNGLASLERAVSAPASSAPSKTLLQQPRRARQDLLTKDNGCTEAGEFHDFIWPCERCGCTAARSHASQQRGSAYDYDFDLTRISIPIPRLWRWRQDSWRPRLTWPGVVVSTLWLLWLGELWARDRYCRRQFAETMVGYGVDINAPEPPFVLGQVLWRKMGMGIVFEVIRCFATVLGWIVGFGGAETGRGQKPVSRDPRIPMPDWGPDLSMMDDEYL